MPVPQSDDRLYSHGSRRLNSEDDFAGEAFTALGSIPGVTDTGPGVDNFHGLKPVELVLMQQHQKSSNSPNSRVEDWGQNLAMEFVKKQKQRFAIK
ncbi:hypothetical protein NQ317_018735 [Molorchus minor]|uniref:Uncharacterized protein n=1 Tax=Molorchus minor TaxID=1323400 RepID=A0ABQ9IQA4_9CUCU|nr:hypothetical protein NQ317_018735 [Molorchus minor]